MRSARNYAAAVRRVLPERELSPRSLVGPAEERLVLVVGCPRSGTTFLAGAIGSLPGFVDLGEVTPLKAAIPSLAELAPERAGPRLRRVLETVRRLGLVSGLRGVEQTPETAFVLDAALRAYPRARVVHMLRDGRDVVCSLLEKGWLGDRAGGDDAGLAYGAHARFWVEAGREEEFGRASEARRAAWAWRRYVGTVRAVGGDRVHELRYEEVARDPAAAARALAAFLDAPEEPLARALAGIRADTVGRHERDLTDEQRSEVEAEAGGLLRALGYR